MAWRVPRSISLWLGTVIVSVCPPDTLRRSLMWLPRCAKSWKPNSPRDLQHLTAGENSQFGHHATASSSIVARIVGSLEKPSSARSSPSICRPMASRILNASSSKVAACVTTGRSRHSATNWRSPLVMRTWMVRFIAGSPQITVYTKTAPGHDFTYNPSVNSRTACSRLALQTLDLHARKTDYRVNWGDSGGLRVPGATWPFGRLPNYTTALLGRNRRRGSR